MRLEPLLASESFNWLCIPSCYVANDLVIEDFKHIVEIIFCRVTNPHTCLRLLDDCFGPADFFPSDLHQGVSSLCNVGRSKGNVSLATRGSTSPFLKKAARS